MISEKNYHTFTCQPRNEWGLKKRWNIFSEVCCVCVLCIVSNTLTTINYRGIWIKGGLSAWTQDSVAMEMIYWKGGTIIPGIGQVEIIWNPAWMLFHFKLFTILNSMAIIQYKLACTIAGWQIKSLLLWLTKNIESLRSYRHTKTGPWLNISVVLVQNVKRAFVMPL